MVIYTIKRILMLIPVLLGVTFITFTVMELQPGDPITLMLGDMGDGRTGVATQEVIDYVREQRGLNEPFFTRYFNWITNMLRGDFGVTITTQRPVVDFIVLRLPRTLQFAAMSTLLMVLIGVPIGVLSAAKQYSAFDVISMVIAMFIASMPGFWVGLLLVLFFSVRLGWLPSFGLSDWTSWILPTVTLALPFIGSMARLVRTTMLEVIRQDYIRTVRAKGASEPYVIGKHAFRNVLIPITTSTGMSFGGMLGGAMLIENIFAFPGIGSLLVGSIMSQEVPTLMASVTVVSVAFCLINLLVDLLYGTMDPRLKSQYISAGKFRLKLPGRTAKQGA